MTGFYNTDGAYSNATFVPSATLSPNATYTVKTTSALKSPAGTSYTPFTSTFTTGNSTCAAVANVNFNQSTFDFSDGTAATTTAYKTEGPSAMALGPNPNSPTQLWVGFGTGNILVLQPQPVDRGGHRRSDEVSTFSSTGSSPGCASTRARRRPTSSCGSPTASSAVTSPPWASPATTSPGRSST